MVSIGMPVYNGAKYLRRALDSLICQTVKDLEIIISDNGSDDDTWDILKEYEKIDNRILLYRQNCNIGAEKNFAFVLQKARGHYFMWAACDDWWAPEYIENLADGLNSHPEHGVAMSSLHRVREDGTFFDKVIYAGQDDLTGLGYRDVFRRMAKIYPSPPVHLFIYGLFRTELLKKLLQQPFQKSIAPDRIFMCEAALATHFYSDPNVLHTRTVRNLSIAERYTEEQLGLVWKDNLRTVKYLIALLTRLVISRNIPLSRKLVEIPLPWLRLVWRQRKVLARSLFC